MKNCSDFWCCSGISCISDWLHWLVSSSHLQCLFLYIVEKMSLMNAQNFLVMTSFLSTIIGLGTSWVTPSQCTQVPAADIDDKAQVERNRARTAGSEAPLTVGCHANDCFTLWFQILPCVSYEARDSWVSTQFIELNRYLWYQEDFEAILKVVNRF